MNQGPREIVDRYFKAMAAGQAEQEALLALFHPEAVYVEPFTGALREHVGAAAIRACVEGSWARSPPGLTLRVDRVDVDGEQVVAQWTCDAPAFAAPVRGEDRHVVRGGKIWRLEVRILEGWSLS